MELLGILGAILLGLVVVGLVVVLLVLLVPVQFAARGVLTEQRADALAGASWGFGLATVRATPSEGVVLVLLGRTVYRFHATPSPRPRRKPARRAARGGSRPDLRLMWRVVRRVVPSLRMRARLAGRVGTGDPADTATLWGLLVTSRTLVGGLDTHALSIDWMEPAIDLEGQVEGRLWPAAILWIAASEYARTR